MSSHRLASIELPIHVIVGCSAAGSLMQAGASEVIIQDDPLCPGPCHSDPDKHRRMRASFLRQLFESWERSPPARKSHRQSKLRHQKYGLTALRTRLRRLSEQRPIVIWTTPTWCDSLGFWWALDGLHRLRIARKRCWIGVPQIQDQAWDGPALTLGAFSSTDYRDAFNQIVPLRANTAKQGALLWRQFTNPSPIAFDRSRREGRSGVPNLAVIASRYGEYFPNLCERRLRLSNIDQSILDSLSQTRWRRPIDFIRKNSPPIELLMGDADHGFIFRLQQWARHQPSTPVFESRTHRNGVSPFNRVSYRLTELGRRIRDEGMLSPDEAPEMSVGGCCLYSPDRTWVRRGRGESWMIEELSL